MATGALDTANCSILSNGKRITLQWDSPGGDGWTSPFVLNGTPSTAISLVVDTGGPNSRTVTATTIHGAFAQVSTDLQATFNLSGFIEDDEDVRLTLTAGLVIDSSITPDETGGTTSTTITNNSTFVGLAPLSELKSYLGITSSSDDAELTRLMRAAASRIEGECGRPIGGFLSKSRTELLNPTGDPSIFIRNTPVTSITSVKRIAPDGTTTTIDADDYRFDPVTGEIRLIVDEDASWYTGDIRAVDWRLLKGRGFWEGFRSVEVVSVGGYTPATMPRDLQQAAIEVAKDLWLMRKMNPTLQSESLADYSYSTKTQTERSEWYQTLVNRYRCPVMA